MLALSSSTFTRHCQIEVALAWLAEHQSAEWLKIARILEQSNCATPHQLITHVYRRFPEQYAEHVLQYLTADRRRLDIGHTVEFDSRVLIRAVVPYLSSDQLNVLETQILNFQVSLPQRGSWFVLNRKFYLLERLKHYGVEQYRLLHAISPVYLSDVGNKRYREWKRKFVDYEISNEPSKSKVGYVGSPIEKSHVIKMSDLSWLRAFQKYRNGIQHHEFLKGGAEQLSSLLFDEIKNSPIRFCNLLSEVPDELDEQYITAFINGFAETSETADSCFAVIRRFVNASDCQFKRAVAWAVHKLSSKTPIPDDIFAMLYGWATSGIGEDEARREADDNNFRASERFLNSDRGAAFIAVMGILDARDSDDARATKWELIEFAEKDDSTVLKVGAIEHLRYMIGQDTERAFELFERLLTNIDEMLYSHVVREFLWASMYKNFKGIEPYLQAMLTHSDESVRRRGAELVCIAFISDNAMEDRNARNKVKQLEKMIMGGDEVWRQGAAHIYTVNMKNAADENTRLSCMEKVIYLLDDIDMGVLEQIDRVFFNLDGNRFFELMPFMELYALSNCKKEGSQFSTYLWEHGMLAPKWSLEIVQTMLTSEYQPNAYWSGVDELMRLTLRVYTSPLVSKETKRFALDTFDNLMVNFSTKAHQLLDEWDRR